MNQPNKLLPVDHLSYSSLTQLLRNPLDIQTMKKAIMEGMIRGYTFKDFLEKNIYAIPFKDNYSLVQ